LDWRYVYRDFSDLSTAAQYRLFEAIKDTLFPSTTTLDHNLVKEIRETRFSKGLACVHCGSKSIKRNGKYRSRQRYLCKDCGKTYNDTTASPLAGTRYPDKWLKYFELMIEGYCLPKISKILDIHISTAFYWRHKILNALRSLGNEQLQGIIEIDETYFLESFKGKKHGIPHRKSRKRGGVAKKRGISKEQVCIVAAHDRNGKIISQYGGRGRITAHEIDSVLGGNINPSSLLCSDSATNYKAFASMKGLSHEVINVRKGEYVKRGLYHIQHVNSYHQRLKKWMERFQGVATKYIDNYMFYFRFLELHKKLDNSDKRKSMLLDSCKKANFMTVKVLKGTA
jgi:transposase-like protein